MTRQIHGVKFATYNGLLNVESALKGRCVACDASLVGVRNFVGVPRGPHAFVVDAGRVIARCAKAAGCDEVGAS